MQKTNPLNDASVRLDGGLTRQRHEPLSSNPHPKGTEENRQWVAGWKTATDTCGKYSRDAGATDVSRRPPAVT